MGYIFSGLDAFFLLLLGAEFVLVWDLVRQLGRIPVFWQVYMSVTFAWPGIVYLSFRAASVLVRQRPGLQYGLTVAGFTTFAHLLLFTLGQGLFSGRKGLLMYAVLVLLHGWCLRSQPDRYVDDESILGRPVACSVVRDLGTAYLPLALGLAVLGLSGLHTRWAFPVAVLLLTAGPAIGVFRR